MVFIKFVLSQFMKYKILFYIFMFSILIEVAYAVAAPLSLKYLVDEAFMPKDFPVFMLILGILLLVGFINICASILGDYSLGKLSGELVRDLRADLFTHLQKQSLPFYQRYKVGDLVSRFSSDMGSMEQVVRGTFPFFLKEALSVLLGLFVLFSIEWKLTLAMIVGSLLMVVGPRLLQGRAETNNLQFKEAQEQFSNIIDEMVKGHKTIRSLHQQHRFLVLARKQINELFSFGLKLHMTNSLMERLPLTALLILNGIMIGFGGYLIFHDQMSVGDFIAFLTLFLSVGQSGSSLTFLISNLIDSNVSFRRVSEILEQQPSVAEARNPKELPSSINSIQMKDVTFGYTDESIQLKDVSVKIPNGSYVAFVGPSGSGKSTALQLLSRFYDPKKGKVLFDGYDLRTVSEDSLRELCLLVGQDTFLFNTTIRENLLLERVDASDEEMMEAAKRANIHDIITSWPLGYETVIHHEGGSLSGGERQRIAIARALLRQPNILLLDEVTSALDPATEADINELIQQIRKQVTIISVTHRLSSVVNADTIYVFQNGQIVEAGSHQELLQANGLYNQLWEKQHGFNLSQDGLHATVEVDRLGKIPFFDGIRLDLLKNIAELFATETFKAGEAIVHEGEEGNKFYIIVRGKFEIMKRDPADGEIQVAILQDGDHFGEIALLKNIPRTATVRAIMPSVALSVHREAFHQITEEHPQILLNLEKTLQERM